MQNWYLLQTKPRAEYQAQAHLNAQGYATFLPEIEVERVRAGRLQRAAEVLFSRYLFVYLDDAQEGRSWAPIRSTKGVSGLVRFGERYAQVPTELVTWLQTARDSMPCMSRAYQPGQTVAITAGPFQGFTAIFASYEGLERAAVFLDLLAKQSRAIFPLSSLAPVER